MSRKLANAYYEDYPDISRNRQAMYDLISIAKKWSDDLRGQFIYLNNSNGEIARHTLDYIMEALAVIKEATDRVMYYRGRVNRLAAEIREREADNEYE